MGDTTTFPFPWTGPSAGPSAGPSTTDMDDIFEPNMTITTTANVVIVMTLQVTDPVAFIADPRSVLAIVEGIAASSGGFVEPEDVSVVLRLAMARRLSSTPRRLQGAVLADVRIAVSDGQAATMLTEALSVVSNEVFIEAISSALSAAGVEVSITGISGMSIGPSSTLCASHPLCGDLSGECCPTSANVILDCCSTSVGAEEEADEVMPFFEGGDVFSDSSAWRGGVPVAVFAGVPAWTSMLLL